MSRLEVTLGCAALPVPCSSSPGAAVTIQRVLQDCSSPECDGSPEPKRPGAPEAASGSQEKLDFNRNLQEGEPLPRRGGLRGRGAGGPPLIPGVFQWCPPLRSCCPVTGRSGFWGGALWKPKMSKVRPVEVAVWSPLFSAAWPRRVGRFLWFSVPSDVSPCHMAPACSSGSSPG